MLKQTCTMLEGQVEELEVMNDEYQDREDQWNLLKLVLRCFKMLPNRRCSIIHGLIYSFNTVSYHLLVS